MDKRETRRLMRERWRAFDGADSETVAIWNRVETSDAFVEARTVLAYMDIEGEVPTAEFMSRWNGCKRFAIPEVAGDSLVLRQYDPEMLVPGFKGILEPSADAALVSPEDVDFALIPGVAFCRKDGKVWRLGRGMGFYDRLIPSLECTLAGVGFSFRLLDELPLDPWDRPLDFFM